MLLFNGSSNKSLAEKLVDALGVQLGNAHIKRHTDGECNIEILTEVRNQNVIILQSTAPSPDQKILELCLFAAELKRHGAKHIIALIPYFAYARQLQHAKVILDLLIQARINKIVTVDLHNKVLLKHSSVLHDLSTAELFANAIKQSKIETPIIVSPDLGGAMRAQAVAELLNADLAIVKKMREKDNSTLAAVVQGSVRNRNCIIIDDIVDTAKTLCAATHALIADGALSVQAYCTHGVLSRNAKGRIEAAQLHSVIITDSIVESSNLMKKIVRMSITQLLRSQFL